MKLAFTALATLVALTWTTDSAWSKGARAFAAGHAGGGGASHVSSGGYGGLHHGVWRGSRGRRYGFGGGGGEEIAAPYVPATPNYVQSDGAGYWSQDKYSGGNPVNQVYH